MAFLLAALLASACALTGCTGGDLPLVGDEEDRTGEPAPKDRSRSDLAPVLRHLLGDRARAIRQDRQRAFERTLAGDDQQALVTEERLFHNFTTLPLARFGYRLDPRGVRRHGDRVTARVWRSVQLEGYDQAPVRTLDRVRFVRAPGSRRGWLIRSGTDEEWRARRGVALQAWDLERVEVREGSGVLLVLDRASLGDAEELLAAVETGIADVARRVPYPWDERVVVYALRDDRFLRRLGDIPGGNVERLDAVTFPVRAEGTTGRLAATRVVIAPRMLRRTEDVRDRLIRHELVHVALGVRDDAVPTWLSEGLAEWVSASDLPEEDQTIAGDAVEVAVDGVEALPADGTFNGPAAGVNYGIAWFACAYVADTHGDEGLWSLFDAMRAADGVAGPDAGSDAGPDAGPDAGSDAGGADAGRLGPEEADAVLRESLGIGSDELAEAASRRIVATFG